MQNSTIQVVGVQVVDAFTAHSCVLCVVNVDLVMPFYNLSNASSKVLHQSYEVIDFICLHQSNSLAFIEFTHAVHEHFYELFLGETLIRVDAHDVLSPFPCEGHEAILTMIALHCDL